jgi:hypothetical protein
MTGTHPHWGDCSFVHHGHAGEVEPDRAPQIAAWEYPIWDTPAIQSNLRPCKASTDPKEVPNLRVKSSAA